MQCTSAVHAVGKAVGSLAAGRGVDGTWQCSVVGKASGQGRAGSGQGMAGSTGCKILNIS